MQRREVLKKVTEQITEEITKSNVQFRREDEFLGMFGALQPSSLGNNSEDGTSERSPNGRLDILPPFDNKQNQSSEKAALFTTEYLGHVLSHLRRQGDTCSRESATNASRSRLKESQRTKCTRGHSAVNYSNRPLDKNRKPYRKKHETLQLEDIMNQMQFDERIMSQIQLRQLTQEKFAFYMKLCNMTERVKVFTNLFNTRRPFYEEHYLRKKEELKLDLLNSRFKSTLNTFEKGERSQSQSRLSSQSKRSKPSRSQSCNSGRSKRESKAKMNTQSALENEANVQNGSDFRINQQEFFQNE